jgi:CRP-like cAMP-binding protein
LLPITAGLEVRHTHEELADMLGLQRETITKILNEWHARGIVSPGRGRVKLVMIQHLKSLASGGILDDDSN